MPRVLIAGDHAVVRQGLKQIVGEMPEPVVVGEAANGQEALDKVRAEEFTYRLQSIQVLSSTLGPEQRFTARPG